MGGWHVAAGSLHELFRSDELSQCKRQKAVWNADCEIAHFQSL